VAWADFLAVGDSRAVLAVLVDLDSFRLTCRAPVSLLRAVTFEEDLGHRPAVAGSPMVGRELHQTAFRRLVRKAFRAAHFLEGQADRVGRVLVRLEDRRMSCIATQGIDGLLFKG
jgi:hypothetical protein